MLTIGLCGSSGSGKGYVSEKMKEYGVFCIDTDKLYATKIAVKGSPCLNELCMFFGKEILNPDGTLDRARLAKKVFEGTNASQHLKALNAIAHKYIRKDVEQTIAQNRESGVLATLIDAPVLFESGFDALCDVTVCVTAPSDLKLSRIIKRDGIPSSKAQARLQSQLSDDRLRELCTYEIINDGKKDLDAQIEKIVKELKID